MANIAQIPKSEPENPPGKKKVPEMNGTLNIFSEATLSLFIICGYLGREDIFRMKSSQNCY